MEFYLHNKDDRKSSTLVNLATTFKLDNVNYIVRKCYESAGFIEKERLYRYYK